MQRRPRIHIGCGIFVINRSNQVLVGQRAKSKLFGLPGGNIDFGESVERAAQRELEEETGLQIPIDQLVCFKVVNSVRDRYHAVDFSVFARMPDDQVPANLEPRSCLGWDFVDWANLQDLPLFSPLEDALRTMSPLAYDHTPESILH